MCNNINKIITNITMRVSTTVSLTKEQHKWLGSNQDFNLSGFVRKKLQEVIDNDGTNKCHSPW